MYIFVSHHPNTGRSLNINTAKKSVENVTSGSHTCEQINQNKSRKN
jgi:hypothetical protein